MEEKSLRQKVADYVNSEQFAEYGRKWIESCHHFFYDGHLFWTNECWIDARLNECDYIRIYQYLIRKLEIELRNKNLTDEDRRYLTQRLNDNRQMFYKELSSIIRDYCIG